VELLHMSIVIIIWQGGQLGKDGLISSYTHDFLMHLHIFKNIKIIHFQFYNLKYKKKISKLFIFNFTI